MKKKYKCVNTVCPNMCEVRTNVIPCNCLYWESKYLPEWKRMGETLDADMQEKTLPKLTAEVFNRPDCPKWAKWAAVDPSGDAYFYIEKPQASSNHWCVPVGCEFFYINRFDASDWRNSLIERPAVLPDWCKVGEWVYFSNAKYYKIEKVDSYGIILAGGIVIKTDDIHAEAVSARLRPYNAAEMRGLVGKTLKTSDGDLQLITAYYNDSERVLMGGLVDRSADEIKERYIHLDGSPCGKLEHMENGEWVE